MVSKDNRDKYGIIDRDTNAVLVPHKYDEIIKNGLKVMDTAACALCQQNNIPIVVFDFQAKGGILDILHSKEIGTYIGG